MITLIISILLLTGCTHIEPYSFPEEFQSSTELTYKGHKVREFKEYNRGELRRRYFGYKDENDKIIYHGLYEGYYEGKVTEKTLYIQNIPEFRIITDPDGKLFAHEIYKNGERWDGKFLIGDFPLFFIFKDGNNISTQDLKSGKVLTEGDWRNGKKWNGSFFNFEDCKIDYYKDGKLVNKKTTSDAMGEH